MLESDLLEVMQAVTKGTLKDTEVRFSGRHACCVILASRGYPVHYDKGAQIFIPEEVLPNVYIAGAAEKDGRLVTSGGRVLGVTAVENTLEEAVREAYRLADRIFFDTKYLRHDIGRRALSCR